VVQYTLEERRLPMNQSTRFDVGERTAP